MWGSFTKGKEKDKLGLNIRSNEIKIGKLNDKLKPKYKKNTLLHFNQYYSQKEHKIWTVINSILEKLKNNHISSDDINMYESHILQFINDIKNKETFNQSYKRLGELYNFQLENIKGKKGKKEQEYEIKRKGKEEQKNKIRQESRIKEQEINNIFLPQIQNKEREINEFRSNPNSNQSILNQYEKNLESLRNNFEIEKLKSEIHYWKLSNNYENFYNDQVSRALAIKERKLLELEKKKNQRQKTNQELEQVQEQIQEQKKQQNIINLRNKIELLKKELKNAEQQLFIITSRRSI